MMWGSCWTLDPGFAATAISRGKFLRHVLDACKGASPPYTLSIFGELKPGTVCRKKESIMFSASSSLRLLKAPMVFTSFEVDVLSCLLNTSTPGPNGDDRKLSISHRDVTRPQLQPGYGTADENFPRYHKHQARFVLASVPIVISDHFIHDVMYLQHINQHPRCIEHLGELSSLVQFVVSCLACHTS
jgi:hypothetical protein